MDQEKLKRKLDDELMIAKIASELLVAGDSPQMAWDKAEKFVSLAPWNRVPVEDGEDNYSDVPKFCRDEYQKMVRDIVKFIEFSTTSSADFVFRVDGEGPWTFSVTKESGSFIIRSRRGRIDFAESHGVITWVRKQYQEMLPF